MKEWVDFCSDRLKRRRHLAAVATVRQLAKEMESLSDRDLRDRVHELKMRRHGGTELDGLLPTMFALVREAARRALDMVHYDVQLIGGMGLHERRVVEMETGEGKTLVAPLAACLFALAGRGVHVLTANDYLAARDAEWMGPLYELLGFRVAPVLCDTAPAQRDQAYQADVTYTTVRQLGFEFLRQCSAVERASLDGSGTWTYLASRLDGRDVADRCLRGRHFAILDEADSVLIDFARSPVTITEHAERQRPAEVYQIARRFALTQMSLGDDFTVDEGRRRLELTDKGKEGTHAIGDAHSQLDLMADEWEERVREALVAERLMTCGREYVVQDGRVEMIDEVTGRLMLGQRLGEEFHQALETKEGVPVQPRQTASKTITVQDLLRPYQHLAGMTGTAWAARAEFRKIYDLTVLRLPPRQLLRRTRRPDRMFRHAEARWDAVTEDICKAHSTGQPILVGTRTVKASEDLSERLQSRGVPHEVLNATRHAEEAAVIAKAGEKGHVTIATNMAGRGVEIPLGEGTAELGGLYVLGTERHEVARLDDQLAGRAGRRGEPGAIQFYASLEDDILKILPERRLKRLQRRYDKAQGNALLPQRVAARFDDAQRRIERHFAEIRQALLKRQEHTQKTRELLYGKKDV